MTEEGLIGNRALFVISTGAQRSGEICGFLVPGARARQTQSARYASELPHRFVSGHGFSHAAELLKGIWALAPGYSKKQQRLKPIDFSVSFGTTEVVP
jgi:hypothetical protein